MAAEKKRTALLRSYGRKRTKRLQGVRQARLDAGLPALRIVLPETSVVPLASLFDFTPQALGLEIGFGGGEHLAALAARHPEMGFLGCEPFMDGVSKLLAAIEEQSLRNIRILDDDVRLLLAKLPDGCLSQVFILFPDPWPKLRHHKRRLINTVLLHMLARVMLPHARLCMVTDDADYAQWMLEHLLASEEFEWTANTPEDFNQPPPGWVETRYQQKAAQQGRAPCFLIAQKR